MSVGRVFSRVMLLLLGGLLCACSGHSGASSGAGSPRALPEPPVARGAVPLVMQLLRTEAQMKRYPFRTLQPFEHPVDLMFLDATGAEPALDGARGHTGASSLRLAPGARSATVKLPSLLSGLPWPDQWTLVGAYLYAARPQRLTATYEVDGRAKLKATVELPANRWTPVLLDLSSLDEASATSLGTLSYSFAEPLRQPVWIDNVHVLNNAETLVPGNEGIADAGPWRVSERGFTYTITYPAGKTVLKLVAPEADPRGWGWTLQEAGPTRVRFAGRGGEGRVRVIYADGRQYIDGQYKPPAAFIEPALARQHQEPGTIAVRPEMGRVNRTAPGDANNDGYCEQTGSYLLVAGGARLEFTLTPDAGVPLTRPVVEISGLPAGEILADMDGRTVQSVARLENGVVLVELPGTLSRPVTVHLRVTGDAAQ